MICLLFGVFIMGMLTNPPATAEETRINQPISINGLSFKVVRKLLNPEENKMVLSIAIDKQSLITKGNVTLTFEPLLLGAKAKDMSIEVYKGDSTYYEIVFSEIPERWQSLRLMIAVNDVDSSQNTFTFHRQPRLEVFEMLDNHAKYSNVFATLRWLKFDIDTLQKLVEETYPTQINDQQIIIEQAREQLNTLDADNNYQTERERKEDDVLKKTIYHRVQQANQLISTTEQQMSEANEKITLLTHQMNRVAAENNIDIQTIHLTE